MIFKNEWIKARANTIISLSLTLSFDSTKLIWLWCVFFSLSFRLIHHNFTLNQSINNNVVIFMMKDWLDVRLVYCCCCTLNLYSVRSWAWRAKQTLLSSYVCTVFSALMKFLHILHMIQRLLLLRFIHAPEMPMLSMCEMFM